MEGKMWTFPLAAPAIGQNVEISRSVDGVAAVKFIPVESHALFE
jgi:hypothetical protein